MNEIRKLLEDELKELDKVIMYASKAAKSKAEGRLRVIRSNGTTQYCLRTGACGQPWKYLRKSDIKTACAIAQKDYVVKLLDSAQRKRSLLTDFMKDYYSSDLRTVYENLSPGRQSLVTPYGQTDAEYAAIWQDEEYQTLGVNIQDRDCGIYTEKEELVRSKSEKIIADKLYMMHIPYHYEKPLFIDAFGTVHPDFTILNIRTREEYYWEHLGMMDRPEYCEKAINKIESYEKSGIFPGDHLILTYETGAHPLNSLVAGMLIQHYLT
jgi:hypothetical protein